MIRTSTRSLPCTLLLLGALVAWGCEEDEGAAGGPDIQQEASGDASPDGIAPACPANWINLEGTACATEGQYCGGESCTGPCAPCAVLKCQDGVWVREEAYPGPDCGQDVIEPEDVPLDGSEPCPTDYMEADGTPCAHEGQRCGGPCTDPCTFCNILSCENGAWVWMEAFPDPACEADVQGEAEEPDVQGEADGEDPCATVGCAAPPMCTAGCTAPCGCCACAEGETRCAPDAAALHACTDEGCYLALPCEANGWDACVDAGPYLLDCASAAPTCDDVQAAYDFLAKGAGQACTTDADCHVLAGQCSYGLGGCWEAVNQHVTDTALRALGWRFGDLGCTQAVCDCMPAPTIVTCSDGVCTATYE